MNAIVTTPDVDPVRGQVDQRQPAERRLKVLFIVSWYPSREQPTFAVFVREHAKAVNLYDDVVVLRLPAPDPKLSGLWRLQEETDETVTEGIPTYDVFYRSWKIPKLSYVTYVWSIIQAYRCLAADGFRPDVIHAHVYDAGILAVIVGKLSGIPVIVTEHFSEFQRKLVRGLDLWKARIAFRFAALVLPVSQSLQQAIEEYGIKARFRVVPNPVNADFFTRDIDRGNHPTRRLLFVGGLDPYHKKGVPTLLQALARVRQQRTEWQLDIVGDGPVREQYERIAADLGLAQNVTFHGNKSRSEVVRFMKQTDFLVLASLWETFSVVTVEALASGKPVVVTQCGGPEEFVTPEVGLVVPKGDVEKLAGAITTMLDRYQDYNAEAIRKYSRDRFSPEAVGQRLHQVYLDVLRAASNYKQIATT